LFSLWCEPKDLVSFDTAFCVSKDRCKLLEMLGSSFFNVNGQKMGVHAFLWVVARSIKVTELILKDEDQSHISHLTFSDCTSRVRYLNLDCPTLHGHKMKNLFIVCPQLETIVVFVHSVFQGDAVQSIPAICQRISEVRLSVDAEHMACARLLTHVLTRLSVSISTVSHAQQLFDLVSSCKHLTNLCMTSHGLVTESDIVALSRTSESVFKCLSILIRFHGRSVLVLSGTDWTAESLNHILTVNTQSTVVLPTCSKIDLSEITSQSSHRVLRFESTSRNPAEDGVKGIDIQEGVGRTLFCVAFMFVVMGLVTRYAIQKK
jgi:hypothetical protein